MNNINKIIDALCSDNSIEATDTEKLERLRDEEIARDNPDFDLIDEITEYIIELKNIKKPEIDIDSEIHSIKRRGIKHNLKFRLPKIVSVAVVVAVIVVANLFVSPFVADSVKNFFPAIYTQENKTILDFNNSEQNKSSDHIQQENSNCYIIKEITKAYGMNVYVPTEGIPTEKYNMEIHYTNDDSGASDIIFFMKRYDNACKSICIQYTVIESESMDSKIVELSEDSVLDSGFIIDGMDAYVFFSRAAARWPNCTREYTMYFYQKISDEKGILTEVETFGLEHDEAYKIFKSFK